MEYPLTNCSIVLVRKNMKNVDWWKIACRWIAAASTPKKVDALLETLLTPKEKQNLAERCGILKLLYEGKTQRDVRDIIKTSIATVSRGAHVCSVHQTTLKDYFDSIR